MNILDDMISSGKLVVHTVLLVPGVAGFVYNSRKGRYHIFISDALSPTAKQKVLAHEVHHLVTDFPCYPYIIGLDMHGTAIEQIAESCEKYLINSTK